MLRDKKIILGVASSVAIYKALDLVRLLKKRGADVHVVMTTHATELISPQLFHAISGNRVWFKQFDSDSNDPMAHVGMLQEADLVMLVPATASLVGRYAMGLATDLLTTMLLGTKAPVLLAPAMNTHMYQHPIVQANLIKLKSMGVEVIEPVEGLLACGIYGSGHLSALETIVLRAERLLGPKDLAGKKVLISSGRTMESLDPVRVLSNRSSGKMGRALARVAFVRGAGVTIVSGGVDVAYPEDIEVVWVESALEMHEAVLAKFSTSDVFVSAAAVGDFRPIKSAKSKLKKSGESLFLELIENPDILKAVVRLKKPHQQVVGFALETNDLIQNAQTKFEDKGVDLLVANSDQVLSEDAGDFVLFSRRSHRSISSTKEELSHYLFNKLSLLRKN
ncbi:MAG: bifunctional phosphopantothenoylcysteine decarboxylase/phosphopantothenate--cysteine ligase CoaBC [Candidatus Peregrinibacteria bacterium]|nr:bifunctional phosphopantothenoylcysteine decarboxylase/phosphopantothenate--cysteine ligase CoaBC [Candidatus Peregrinibacteria bacterium]